MYNAEPLKLVWWPYIASTFIVGSGIIIIKCIFPLITIKLCEIWYFTSDCMRSPENFCIILFHLYVYSFDHIKCSISILPSSYRITIRATPCPNYTRHDTIPAKSILSVHNKHDVTESIKYHSKFKSHHTIKRVCGRALSGNALHSQCNWKVYDIIHKY